MSLSSLATSHRPHCFDDVVGQRHVKVPLQRALTTGRLPQQLLFVGGSGLGKTTLARIVAMSLLCADRSDSGEPCGICPSCVALVDGTHPDVIEFDAASHGLKENMVDLAARATLAPMLSSHRVFIIDEAHGLSNAGGQAFLKLLEEPPPHVIFALATTDPDKMLRTNRSRCVEFELVTPTSDELADNLRRVADSAGLHLDDRAADEIVAASSPDLGVRGCVMLLEKVSSLMTDSELSADDVAELLGRPARTDIERLFAAFTDGDRGTVFDVFDMLTARFAIKDVLLRCAAVAKDHMVAAADPYHPATFATAQRRLDVFLAASVNPSPLTAASALARLCTDSDPVVELEALTAHGETVVAELRALTANARISELPADTEPVGSHPAATDTDTDPGPGDPDTTSDADLTSDADQVDHDRAVAAFIAEMKDADPTVQAAVKATARNLGVRWNAVTRDQLKALIGTYHDRTEDTGDASH